MKRSYLKFLIVFSATLAVLVTGATTVLAGGALHFSEEIAGDQIVCGETTYTATSGVVNLVIHEGESASGNRNFTGTVTPKGVTVVDQDGNTFKIQGADSVAGTFNNQNGEERGAFTTHLNITGTGSGVVDRVSITGHFSSDGNEFFLDKGTCVLTDEE